MEGTVCMIMCIPLAYGLSSIKVAWFFQGMMIIGGRYLAFASIYGMHVYWIVGAVLGLGAYILFKMQADTFTSALTGGLIEILFGSLIYRLYKYNKQKTINN
jgi:hypothetical protein